MTENKQEFQVNPAAKFRQDLDKMKGEIEKSLPKGIDPDRFIRTAVTLIQMRPKLLRADRQSLFSSLMTASKDGLLVDDREATIQVYNTNIGTQGNPNWIEKCSYMPMVRGVITKMYEAGCRKVEGIAVYEKDHFRFLRGDDDRIEHEVYIGEESPGNIIAAYAIVMLANGEIKREVMTRHDIKKVRDASESPKGPGWNNWEDQFAIKAVIKRIAKQVPESKDPDRNDALLRVIQHDNDAMQFDLGHGEQHAVEHKTEATRVTQGKSSRLEEIIGNRDADKEPVQQNQEEHHENN